MSNEMAAKLIGADHVLTEDGMRLLIAEVRQDERKATVERIRTAALVLAERYAAEHDLKPYAAVKYVLAILDAEAGEGL